MTSSFPGRGWFLARQRGTLEGVSVAAVGLVAFFLEFAGLVLVEARVSVPAVWEVGALKYKTRKLIKFIQQILFFIIFAPLTERESFSFYLFVLFYLFFFISLSHGENFVFVFC